MENRNTSYMDNIFDIPTITNELNKEFINSFKENMLALINGYTQENFLGILKKQITELESSILKMLWPIRVKDEIRMYLQLFSDCLLTNYNEGNKSLKIQKRAELLFLIIKSLVPSMSVEEKNTKEDLKEMRKNNLIKLVQTGEGNLIEVCNVLLQDFGIIEQRNIGAPQFCITELKWDSEKKEKIQISGCTWASVPLGVYRKDNINEIEEQKLFIENYPVMMMKLKTCLESYGFEIYPYDIGLGFKVEYKKDEALKHIENYFKICLFTAGTALFDKKDQRFIGGNQPMTKEFKIDWDKEEPMITFKVINQKLLEALTNSKDESDVMLRGLIKGLGWELNKPSGKVLTYTCTRPLWSLIHGLECWMSKTVLEDFDLIHLINDPSNYCTYVVTLQNKIGEKIWNSEPRPDSLVYRPDNPNFTERDDVGLHYHIHVYQGKKGDKKFEGGRGFSMVNYSTAAPLWQGFKIFQNFK